jgi:transposase
MKNYQNFIGIDIGKYTFVVALYGQTKTHEYENTTQGIAAFFKDMKSCAPHPLCILEVTGGYEMPLLLDLCKRKWPAHRTNNNHVKNFIRSYGMGAKTDRLDAKALAHYGKERHSQLVLFVPPSKRIKALQELAYRREDLKRMIIGEKTRLKAPSGLAAKDSCKRLIKGLEEEMLLIHQQLQGLMDQEPDLQKRAEIAQTIPGIGPIIGSHLAILLPELGSLNRRQIAALACLAPRSNDIGTYKGYRFTGGGRRSIKPLLYMAAMAAAHSDSWLGEFYQKLLAKGKKKMVALVALMRKILVIANARIKDAHL